ncbi:non-canonical purine NTP pyrophosphatase [Bartonella henselae]|uniref:dITP/XTP pyrophosphatase n=3 Tax=Bartonella TaxID=773 RepID=IXTPA_BARHE|nr:RdgB/HAM1 family non-canonical purine NTP pyrophosphatase [Bartonella henselae]Q6G565.1 RecName: Full=dITP/XTP pyrophosphatase; AltName: Full=Non-canonical purine NTP pyrophosphatase; AltName: Full=Non-standard purine NTP pyrophosphatase; AltName: Full=Nucleoside-triphosphate diphosphatase; AltName: Full=Nucleoside-triphosphate pyrophosphatase; Short=NTPase [Bartonella henselae str. Houston-1]ATP11705.1 non-canonical purine NTP pyrophosphatase [Bartonella henselae]ETS09277.1 nucleoside-tripho
MRSIANKKLVIATHNIGKLQEITTLVAPFGLTIQSAKELGLPEPKETGTTFEENAYIKAFAAAKNTGLPALSDDSGLEVDALNGAPGVYTADLALQSDGTRDFLKAMQKIEEKLQKIGAHKKSQRKCRFISVICIAWPDAHADYFHGRVEGSFIWPPRGDKGFGFDPVFLPDGYKNTFGEMTTEQKHGWKLNDQTPLSHRACAFKLLAENLLKLS